MQQYIDSLFLNFFSMQANQKGAATKNATSDTPGKLFEINLNIFFLHLIRFDSYNNYT